VFTFLPPDGCSRPTDSPRTKQLKAAAIKRRAIRKAEEEMELHHAMRDGESSLWVDKYAPKSYVDLLSDEVMFVF
jgi:hypothetical protein